MLFIITTTKVLSQRARGRARLFFSFLFFIHLFIYFINSIQLRFLKTPASARARRTRRLPEFTVSRARSHGLMFRAAPVRLCAPYVLARTRTTSTDAPRSPNMLAHVSKKIRKSKQKSRKLEKNERKSFSTLAVTSQCRIKRPGGP